MINSWREDIRRTGELRIAEKSGIKQAPWKGLLRRAIAGFNDLSARHDLGVIFVADNRLESAQVTVDTKPGTSLVGNAPFQTLVPGGRPDSEGRVFRCDITVPADPKVSVPQGLRRVGSSVLLVMLVHELVHACGLSNEEHSRTGDLFMASPRLLPGDNAAGDLVDSGRVDAGKNGLGMPPLLLNDDTVRKIRQSWQGPTASAPAPRASLASARLASALRGPVGLIDGSVTLAGSRRPGPLALSPGVDPIRHVWS